MWILVMIALRSIPSSAVVGKECRRDSGGPVEESDPFFKFQCFAGCRVCHVCGAHIFARQPGPPTLACANISPAPPCASTGKSSLFEEKCVNTCLKGSGAGDGNRTHGSSLGSLGITIIRRPRLAPILVAFAKVRQYRRRNSPRRRDDSQAGAFRAPDISSFVSR
jgi:hypothetical protein